MVLWEKESNNCDAILTDLFAGEIKSAAFIDWDRKLRSSNWKNLYLYKQFDPKKDNRTSDSIRAEGNMYFKMGQYVEAMEFYSISLLFAEPGTKNVSFAFANRATCFLNRKMFDECLRDIDLAIIAKYPDMPKLMQRKKNCEEQMKRSKSKQPFEPKLDFNPNEKFPCMADVLEIKQNEEFGRHIVAKDDIDVGQTVLVEDCFVSVACSVDRVQCYNCLQSSKNFIACSKCTDVVFCSDECQNTDQIHRKFCGEVMNRMPSNVKYITKSVLLGLIAFPSGDQMIKFVSDILLQRNKQIPPAANDTQSKYGLFLSLQPAKEKLLDIGIIYQTFTALLTIPFVGDMFASEQSRRFLMHLVAEHFLIISNNSFEGLTNSSTVGTVSSILSLFNHACAPNLFNSTLGKREVCITMRPIKKGEQVFVKYLCGDRTTRQRQEIIMKQWGFLCKCDKCDPHCKPSDIAKMQRELQSYHEFAVSRKKCETFLRQYGHLPWSEQMNHVLKCYTQHLLEDFPSF